MCLSWYVCCVCLRLYIYRCGEKEVNGCRVGSFSGKPTWTSYLYLGKRREGEVVWAEVVGGRKRTRILPEEGAETTRGPVKGVSTTSLEFFREFSLVPFGWGGRVGVGTNVESPWEKSRTRFEVWGRYRWMERVDRERCDGVRVPRNRRSRNSRNLFSSRKDGLTKRKLQRKWTFIEGESEECIDQGRVRSLQSSSSGSRSRSPLGDEKESTVLGDTEGSRRRGV